jgi:hypothetical protein
MLPYSKLQMNSDYKTTVMMFFVIAIFYVCNTLPFALNAFETFQPEFFINSETIAWAYATNDVRFENVYNDEK